MTRDVYEAVRLGVARRGAAEIAPRAVVRRAHDPVSNFVSGDYLRSACYSSDRLCGCAFAGFRRFPRPQRWSRL